MKHVYNYGDPWWRTRGIGGNELKKSYTCALGVVPIYMRAFYHNPLVSSLFIPHGHPS